MTCHVLNAHFVETYKSQLQSGLGSAAQDRYYGTSNATKEDDDSLTSIANSIVHIQMANSPQTNILNETISALSEETRGLRESSENMQQQYAAMMMWQPQAPPQTPPTVMHTSFAPQPPLPPQQPIPQYVPSPKKG